MIRILIADDHTIVRRGLKQILLEEFSSAFIDEAADAEVLLKKVMKEEWDVLLISQCREDLVWKRFSKLNYTTLSYRYWF